MIDFNWFWVIAYYTCMPCSNMGCAMTSGIGCMTYPVKTALASDGADSLPAAEAAPLTATFWAFYTIWEFTSHNLNILLDTYKLGQQHTLVLGLFRGQLLRLDLWLPHGVLLSFCLWFDDGLRFLILAFNFILSLWFLDFLDFRLLLYHSWLFWLQNQNS